MEHSKSISINYQILDKDTITNYSVVSYVKRGDALVTTLPDSCCEVSLNDDAVVLRNILTKSVEAELSFIEFTKALSLGTMALHLPIGTTIHHSGLSDYSQLCNRILNYLTQEYRS